MWIQTEQFNSRGDNQHKTQHRARRQASLEFGFCCFFGGGVFQREHPVQRTAAGFLREGELRTHWVAETERSANTHSASPATKALDRPARKCQERQVSSCSRKGSGAHATACVQRAGLGISSVRQMQRVRKTGLGDGLGAQGASENEQGNKDKHLSGSAFQALLSRRHRPLSYTRPGRRPGLEPPATCLLRAASPHSPKPAAEMPFPGQDFKQKK